MVWESRRDQARQRATMRTLLIVGGIFDMALAGFFLAFGASAFGIEKREAWLIAAALAAGAVVILFVATLGFGRKGEGRELDEGENDDEPVVRR